MESQLEKLYQQYIQLKKELESGSTGTDYRKSMEISMKIKELEPFVSCYNELKEIQASINDALSIIEREKDHELVELAREELKSLESRKQDLETKIKDMLLPTDPSDDKNAILEIRAGVGGEEAALFAADLFRMYSRWAEKRGFTVDILSTNETGLGGYKEIICLIKGKGAYGLLKHESGPHRVQRIPVTESGGRIHTSTATVAVLPEAEDVDVKINSDELKIETFRASGPGGQHVNTTDSAVRITHIPSGITVVCRDERSQHKNRAKAMKILRARLLKSQQEEAKNKQDAQRKKQIKSGDRSEKIRTYNFPQNRVTDHRIGLTLKKLDRIMDGDIDEIINELRTREREKLANN